MEEEKEDIRMRIRSYLQKNNIKLWEEYNKDLLSNDISTQLHCDIQICNNILQELEHIAKERLHMREVYQQTGEAAIRIKFTGSSSVSTTSSGGSGVQKDKETVVKCKLSDHAHNLLQTLASQTSVSSDRLKLIHKGKIIKPDATLESQGVRHGSLLLLIVLPVDDTVTIEKSEVEIDSDETRRDAEYLTENDFGEFLQLEDQDGNLINFPKEQKKALTVAVTLQERGRTALKRKEYSRALVYLLDADKLYAECASEILKRVDNYGLLNLDIAWCYLHLKSITHIPDASERLKVCEKNFRDTYGKDLSRLKAVKGDGGYEKVLLLRLHLLQGIVLYYENKRAAALKILKEVETQLITLKIDEGSIQAMVDMGYTAFESKLALRACSGTISEAVDFIAKQRLRKEKIKKKSVEEQKDRVLGKCDDGIHYVSSKTVEVMQSMGYSKKTAVNALKKFNNDLNNAVDYVSQQYEKVSTVPDELKEVVRKMISVGYDTDEAVKTLQTLKSDIESNIASSSTSGIQCEATSFDFVFEEDNIAKIKRAEEAYKRLTEVIDNVEDDGLELNLAEEEEFLKCYLNLLKR